MYITECVDGTYYTGSTTNLARRIEEHNRGEGARYTAKKRPVVLVYSEEYDIIEEAQLREKQVQGWSHKKKQLLVEGKSSELPKEASCRNITHYKFRNLREL